MADKKKPVWREKRGTFPYYRKSWMARLNGWVLEVRDTYDLGVGGVGLGKWCFFADRQEGKGAAVYNSGWTNNYWPTCEEAQSAAEQYAREAPRG